MFLEWWQVRVPQLKWTHYFLASGFISSFVLFGPLTCCFRIFFSDHDCENQSREGSGSTQQESPKTQKIKLVMREGCKCRQLCRSGQLIKQTPLTQCYFCLAFFKGVARILTCLLLLLFAFNSLKPDTHLDIQKFMKNA